MKNFKVYNFDTGEDMGDFLNVGVRPSMVGVETVVWYFCDKTKMIKSAYLEEVNLIEVK